MKKKVLLTLLAIVCICALCFGIVSCSPQNGNDNDTNVEEPDVPLTPDTECQHTNLSHEAETSSTCNVHGHTEYWFCGDCNKYFANEACTVETTLAAVTKAYGDHKYGEWIDEEPADCTDNGTLGHYHCSVCQKNFDAEKEELTSIVIPAAHDYGTWVPAVQAEDCQHRDRVGYYYCEKCDTYFDEDYEVIPTVLLYGAYGPHKLEHDPAVTEEEADCGEYYYGESWYCTVDGCEAVFADAQGREPLDFVETTLKEHNYVYTYNYKTCEYDGVCSHNSAHTDTIAAGTEAYPYLANDEASLKAAVAKGGYVKLTADLTLTKAVVFGKNACLDLNEKKITTSSSIKVGVDSSDARPVVTIKNGEIARQRNDVKASSTVSAQYYGTLYIYDCKVSSNVDSALSIWDEGGIFAERCEFIGAQHGLATNAGTGNYTDKLYARFTDCTIDAQCAGVLWNIPANFEIANSTISAVGQGLIARGGKITVTDTTITKRAKTAADTGAYTNTDYTKYESNTWGSGSNVPGYALVVGNRSTSYQYATDLTLNNVDINIASDVDAKYAGKYVYAYGNTAEGFGATITYDEECSLGDITVGNDSVVINGYQCVVTGDGLNAAVAKGGNIKLMADITADVVIAQGKEVNLNLNGYRLSNSASHTIVNNGTLTLIGGGTVYNGTHKMAALSNTGVATVNGVTLERIYVAKTDTTAPNSHYTVDNTNGGTMTLINATVISENNMVTSLVRNIGATMTIESGEYTTANIIIKNDDEGVLTVNGGKFVGIQSIQNWGTATINGGEVTYVKTAIWSSEYKSTTYINDNNFGGELVLEYNENYVGKYLTDDSAPVLKVKNGISHTEPQIRIATSTHGSTENEGYSVVTAEESGYTVYTLALPTFVKDAAAFKAALANGGNIKLMADMPIDEQITISNDTAINLNGHTITYSGTTANTAAIRVNAGRVTITNGSVISTDNMGFIVAPTAECVLTDCDVTAKTYAIYANGKVDITGGTYTANTMGLAIFNGGHVEATDITVVSANYGAQVGNGTEAKKGMLILHGGSVSGDALCGIITYGYSTVEATGTTISCAKNIGFMGNGTCVGDNVTLTNCTVTGGKVGLYFPQKESNLTVNGGTYTGSMSGVEVRGGTAEIDGATLAATSETFATAANGDGATVTGAALAVSQHTTDGTISVTVTNCTLKGIYALYEKDVQNETARDQIAITLGEGNTLNGYVYSENCENIVDTADGSGNALTETTPEENEVA